MSARSGLMVPESRTQVREPHDALTWLQEAAAALPQGELCMSTSLSLHDSMNAIEIMDPRIDMGMATQEERQQPAFHPERSLPAEVVVFVMDEVLRREMTFYAGHALPLTLYTCLYITHFKQFPSVTQVVGPDAPELVSLVLRSYVLATLKTADTVWGELIRDNIREVPADPCTSETENNVYLADDVTPDETLMMLDEAYEWLSKCFTGDYGATVAALMDRLRLRMEILYALCLIYEPYHGSASFDSVPDRCQEALSCLDMIRRFPSKMVDPLSTAGIFDPHVSRSLPTSLPPRCIEMISLQQSFDELQKMLKDMVSAHGMTSLTHWLQFERTFFGLARRRPVAAPFGRSLFQSLFFSDNVVVRHRSLSWLAARYLEEVAGWTNARLDSLIALADTDQQMAFHIELDRWLGQLASVRASTHQQVHFSKDDVQRLVNLFSCLGANRPRQKQKLQKSLVDWQRFLHQTRRFLDMLSPLSPTDEVQIIFTAIERVQSLITVEAIFSGFDLRLYADVEQSVVYWVAFKAACQHLSTIDELIDRSLSSPQLCLEAERNMFVGIRSLSFASLLMTINVGTVAIPRPDDAYWHMRFEYRFEWLPLELNMSPATEGWAYFCREMDASHAKGMRGNLAEAMQQYRLAKDCFLRALNDTLSSHSAKTEEEQHLRMLLDTASCNLLLDGSDHVFVVQMPRKHAWFPIFGASPPSSSSVPW